MLFATLSKGYQITFATAPKVIFPFQKFFRVINGEPHAIPF
jgi:hypothetical protein